MRNATVKRWISVGHALVFSVLWTSVLGCDRPFVEIEPPEIRVVSPDLGEVSLSDQLSLVVETEGLRNVSRLEVNGERSQEDSTNLFSHTTQLKEGINRIDVVAFTQDGQAGDTTLFAAYFPYGTFSASSAELPTPRSGHTATLLNNGSLFVCGGVNNAGTPLSTAVVIREVGSSFSVQELSTQMAVARTGHTASLLPDGRVLIVGGSIVENPMSSNDLVELIEIFDPATQSFSTVGYSGEPVARAFHTTQVLARQESVFLYALGGRGPVQTSEIGTRGDAAVLEFRHTTADSLINISAGGALPGFQPVGYHSQLSLPPEGSTIRSLVSGTYYTDETGTPEPVSYRLLSTPSDVFYPFELLEESLPQMNINRIGHAASLLSNNTGVFTGGYTPEGTVLHSLELFSDEASRYFRFPTSISLRTARYRHTATLLSGNRILLLGGIDSFGSTISSAELLLRTDN